MQRLHLVYFHPDKYNGYGACYEDNYPQRVKTQRLDVTKARVIKTGLTLDKASELESILQVRDGFPLDDKPYKEIVRLGAIGRANMTQESINKRKANTDYSKSTRGLKKIWESKKQRVKVTLKSDDSIVGIFRGLNQAARILQVDKANAAANASRKRTGKRYPLSVKGYVFEYIDR